LMMKRIGMWNLLVSDKAVGILKSSYTLDPVWTGTGFDNAMTCNLYNVTISVTSDFETPGQLMVKTFGTLQTQRQGVERDPPAVEGVPLC